MRLVSRKLVLRGAALLTGVVALFAAAVGPASAAASWAQHDMNDYVAHEGEGFMLWGANDYLAFQNDGNLVLYNMNQQPLWASNTFNQPYMNNQLALQADGNLVIYSANALGRTPIWSTNTWGHYGSRLVLQQDGNLVIYDAYGRALWGSGTNYWPGCGNGC